MNPSFDRDKFLFDGNPRFLFGGDFNYTRCRAADWRDRMLKLKAAGCNTLSMYATWAFHEPEEGVWDFSGDHDLAGWLDTANELGLWVIFRMGPFVHGEWRNGGLPQWLLDRLGERARTNDPEYLKYTRRWYDKMLSIALPRLYSKGGPIIMLQAENELGSAGWKGDNIARGSSNPDENAKHVLFFLDMVLERGADVPIIDINHFTGRDEMPNLIRAGGMYVQNCFGAQGDFADFSVEGWERHDRPMLAIEAMGGMFTRFFDWPIYPHTRGFQGPIVKPEIIEAMSYLQLAEGHNAYLYYILVDGQHPDLADGTTAGERMLPPRDMNFQSPITATGDMRDSYGVIKRLGWFLRAFEREFLDSAPRAGWLDAYSFGQANPGANEAGDLFQQYQAHGQEAPDILKRVSKVKSLARVKMGLNLSESNFAFLLNTSTRGSQWKRDVRMSTQRSGIASEVPQEYPRRVQLDLAPQRNKCIPFYVKLAEGCYLEHSTAELLDRRPLGGGVQLILHADADEVVETRLIVPARAPVHGTGEYLCHWDSPNTLTLLHCAGSEFQATFIDGDIPVRIVLMERENAGRVWDIEGPDGAVVGATNLGILGSRYGDKMTTINAQTDEDDFSLLLFSPRPAVLQINGLQIEPDFDLRFGACRYAGQFPRATCEIDWSKRREPGRHVWSAIVRPDVLTGARDVRFDFDYVGTGARAYLGKTLISDHYYGKFQSWQFGLRHWLTAKDVLRVEVNDALDVRCRISPVIDFDAELLWEK